jgi:hypothetical protein
MQKSASAAPDDVRSRQPELHLAMSVTRAFSICAPACSAG